MAGMDDRDGYIWFNGNLMPWRGAKVHVLTHGLHYGSCVFEGVRSYNGRIFKLEDHTRRLFASAKTLDMKVPFTEEQLNAAQVEVLRGNNLTDGYLRPLIWRGTESISVSAQAATINVAVACWVWPSYFTMEARMRGIRLQMSDWRRPAPDMAPVHAKAAGLYMICTLSKHKAEAAGYEDALMLDYRGYVAEATGANVFFVAKGEIHTPTPDCFLDGITRKTVIELAKRRGYKVIERHIKPEEMANYQECFITGTAAEVTPVREVGSYKFTPGEVCKTLMADYDAETGKTAATAAA
jgi:branched-chain amino acid aminotransferase